MVFRIGALLIVFLLGSISSFSRAQDLATECWDNNWTKYLEKCYLVVSYKHSWAKAYDYCSKYGARLAEPAGIIVNGEVAGLVRTDFWIGYNLLGISVSETYNGKWSDGRPTSVKVGVWGQNQPDLVSGACVYVRASGIGNFWYSTDCDRVMPFVCEMTPCPQGMFQCSGRCINSSRVCDGTNDCGDNRDELNCPSKCTYYDTGNQGTINQETSQGNYEPRKTCQWTIETTPGQRINVQFQYIDTEANTDFLEIWDGGLTLATSTLLSRLSGQPNRDQLSLISSYNFLILRFVSDASLQNRGFHLTWKTEYECADSYKTIPASTFSNGEIQEGADLTLGSKQSVDHCERKCDKSETCYGFVYIEQISGASCKLFNALPILAADNMATVYMKMCPPDTHLEASVALPATSVTATSVKQQLSSPLYPLPYIGNMELEYSITTEGNNLITLEILDIELCCDDAVDVYDGTATSHTLLEALTSASTPHLLISTSPAVFIKLTLNNHWKCRGVLITYKQGCDNILTETGALRSPGYGTPIGYPGFIKCSWTLRAPSEDRSITIAFEDFDLEQDMDFLTVETSEGISSYTGTQLLTENSITADNFTILTLTTSAIQSGAGFKASFSPGCSSLQSDSVVLVSNNYNYLDEVTLSCAEGYHFIGDFASENEVTVTCITGGVWDKSPVCARGYCGAPPHIANGYIVSATGVQGGDTAAYECDSGFSANTSMVIRCNANDTWDMAPNCTSGNCQSINSVTTDVRSSILHGDGIQYGSVVRLSCSEYREIHGAATVQCMDGSWDFVSDVGTICHSKPCQTPVIPNAYFDPGPLQPYVVNQAIAVSCKSGYRLIGPSVINCNVTEDLPRCEQMQCILDFAYIVPLVNPNLFVYDYGERVEVACNSSRYKMNEFHTSTVNLTCLNNGQWNKQLSCSRLGCGIPEQVRGSFYDPLVPCVEHNCTFTFTCKNKYELYGESSLGNNIVTCGHVYDGLWDFGNLRCIGGQCPDPGYPASGYMMSTGASFQEGSTVMFGCNKPGYGPDPADGITCIYNESTGQMEWDSPLPTCIDLQVPIINNCPTSPKLVTNMQPAGFAEPFAVDLNLKSFTASLPNFHPEQPVYTAMSITYRAQDFAGNTATCRVSILISGSISCKNSESLNYLIETAETIDSSVIAERYVVNKDPNNVFLYYSPNQPNFQVTQTSDMLARIDEVEVRAADKDQNLIESCRLQIRYRGYKCSEWGIHIPGGGVNCEAQSQSKRSCHAYCKANKTFMEDPGAASKPIECTEDENEGIWNRPPPVCASISSAYVAYTAIFDYKYSIPSGVSNWASCVEVYRQQLETVYPILGSALQALCTANSQNNPVTIITKGMTQASFTYSDDTNTMGVRFEVLIDLEDETVDNVLDLKDACTGHIQTAFNKNTSEISSIRELAGNPPTCGTGSFKSYDGTSLNEYGCEGNRKYYVYKDKNNKDVPSCLTCPLGYFMENEDCSPCPVGTFGVMANDEPSCQLCPGTIGPGKTGLTDKSQCELQGICQPGYYSSDGLTPCTPCPKSFYSFTAASQTCAPCPSDKVTNSTGASSESECNTLEETSNETSVCNPNPCGDTGTCSFQRRDYYCTCKEGYTGRNCEDPFDACSSNPCENSHQCVPKENNTFTCSCSAEFNGDRCENDISTECDGVNRCENNGTCHNRRGGYTCICPAAGGYTNDDGSCNTQIDQCTANPCIAGTCVSHGSFYRSCDCYPGYTGIDCDVNIDDCNPNPCVNGGVCVDGFDSFNCTCGDDYYGDFCQFGKACNRQCDTFVSVCNACRLDNTEECENFGNSYICHCKSGFTGTDCEIEDSTCSSYPCKHGGICQVHPENPGYRCECSEPWTGTNCDSEISNCPDGDYCYNAGICYSTPTGFQCDCTNDFIGPACNISYDLCTRVDACVGNGICSYTDESGFNCSCDQGFNGESCQIPDPVCTSDYCLNGGTCSEDGGSLLCSCVGTGYDGQRCDVNVNDCDPNPCGTNQQCIDMVNDYVCACDIGKRGENCDKDVGIDFDYIIGAPYDCRLNENVATFGDGSTPISQLTVAFWSRYTQKVGEGTILNVYGSVSGTTMLPRVPDFGWRFDAAGLTVGVNDNKKRKKRAEKSVPYGVEVADGFWHHVAMTWSTNQNRQELTVYVDGLYRDQLVETLPSSKRGFLVFGAYDTSTQTGDSMNSFKGRISRLFVTGDVLADTKISELYSKPFSPPEVPLLLHQEANLMLQYMIDYHSEITDDTCRSGDTTCDGLYDVSSLPGVSSCDDVLVVTNRTTAPAWPSPTFTNTASDTQQSNRVSGGTNLDWGLYGISVAEFDQNDNVAVCSFRLYNYPIGCANISDRTDISCTTSEGDERCEGSCTSDQQLTGSVSAYQTCSKYSMWDEARREESYNYPECAATEPLKYKTTLTLTVEVTNTNCENLRETYSDNYLGQLNAFNYEYNNELCGGIQCANLPSNNFTCDVNRPHEGTINIDFGLLPGILSSGSWQVTPAEALRVAVADDNVFYFEQTVNGVSQTVTPIWHSLNIDATEACEPGYQISGYACVLCGSGTFFNEPTTTCERCAQGFYRNILDDETTPISPCKRCPGSSNTASDGSPDQSRCVVSCLAGRYYNEVAKSCADCEKGFYQPQSGAFSCISCSRDKTTDGVGKTSVNDCVSQESITKSTTTTTESPSGPQVGAATESGLSTGVIVAVVLGVIIGVLIIVLLICLLCFKCQVPCLAKKTQEVAPEVKEKDRYYANKYGEREMKFVNYNLPHIREKKGRPLDKEPFVEPPLSEESGSVKNDISIHVPVFMEKLDGSVSKKHMFISNNLNVKSPSSRVPMTSSPRANIYHDIDFGDERKHKKKHRKKNRKPAEFDGTVGGTVPIQNGQVPKALAPLPQKIKSLPPEDVHIRPSSALERPRELIVPSHYENLLPRGSLERGLKPTSSSERELLATTSSEREITLPRTSSERETIQALSTERDSRATPSPEHEINDYEDYRYPTKRIEVESDTEDLR